MMKPLICASLLGCLLGAPAANAKSFALVVGIDQYAQAESAGFARLQGAVNDAQLLAQTLRGKGVDLPDSRVLLNEKATLAHFKAAWQSLLEQATPGDQILFTFAGHGSQEEEFAAPWDEKDRKDETLLFHDFDPANPYRGRLSDDELYALFEQARAFNILFVADACHSGGITRAVPGAELLPRRGGGPLSGFKPKPPAHEYDSPASDDSQILSHVTFLTATENEANSIPEVSIEKTPHGALSWVFSKAFQGEADSDKNHIVSLSELEEYVESQVRALTNHHQFPGMLPRGSAQDAFPATGQPASPPSTDSLAIAISGGSEPAGLRHVFRDAQDYRLRFEIAQGKATVFNPQGDQLAQVDANSTAAWNALIAKYRLLAALDHAYNTASKPVKISLRQGDGLHSLGDPMDFSFDPNSEKRYLLLFDLAGNGDLQFLYPLKEQNDNPAIAQSPYTLSMNVAPPTGEDDLVAVFCGSRQPAAESLLQTYNGKPAPEPAEFLRGLGQDCQIGRYAFFTQG
jgi:uncharacterized caspase-like protein